MHKNSIAIVTMLVVSLFFITPALACNFPGPAHSSITVTVYASDGTTPLPGATVSIENASSGCSYVSDTTNSNGQFTFTASPDNVYGITYKVHATYDGNEINVQNANGVVQCAEHSVDSGTFTLKDNEAKSIYLTMPGVTVTHVSTTVTPRPSECPTVTPIPPSGRHSSYPPMSADMTPGSVYGVVIMNGSSCPVSGAYVAIVNSTDRSIQYAYTYTDGSGLYQILEVNSTDNAAYRIYAVDCQGDKAYSDPIQVGSGKSVRVDMTLRDKSACTVTQQPTVTATPSEIPPANSATPVPTASGTSSDHTSDTAIGQGHQDLFSQIAGFFGSIFSSIFHN